MFGISYGELFLLIGATAALVGPKDLPIIARTAGRLAGRAIGYVQVARGQFESVMGQSQVRQMHKELQDTLAQVEAIRQEIRRTSLLNPGFVPTRPLDNIATNPSSGNGNIERKESSNASDAEGKAPANPPQDSIPTVKSMTKITRSTNQSPTTTTLSDIQSQATTYARLAGSASANEMLNELTDESGGFIVLPISAESANLLPSRKGEMKGSDILLEAILEADVASKAKDFFSQPPDQITNQ